MNEGIHLDLDTWIVPGQIRKANLCRGLGNRLYTVYRFADQVLYHYMVAGWRHALRSEWPFITTIVYLYALIQS